MKQKIDDIRFRVSAYERALTSIGAMGLPNLPMHVRTAIAQAQAETAKREVRLSDAIEAYKARPRETV